VPFPASLPSEPAEPCHGLPLRTLRASAGHRKGGPFGRTGPPLKSVAAEVSPRWKGSSHLSRGAITIDAGRVCAREHRAFQAIAAATNPGDLALAAPPRACHASTSEALAYSASGGVYSITSSARARRVGGTVRPSERAAPKLMTSSNRVGC
jgi:hypothetical protein